MSATSVGREALTEISVNLRKSRCPLDEPRAGPRSMGKVLPVRNAVAGQVWQPALDVAEG
jgi:hypothetical protein